MTITVLYFAALRERMQKSRETITCSPAESVADVARRVLGFTDAVAYAINDEFVEKNATLKDGDTLALIPPMAGG